MRDYIFIDLGDYELYITYNELLVCIIILALLSCFIYYVKRNYTISIKSKKSTVKPLNTPKSSKSLQTKKSPSTQLSLKYFNFYRTVYLSIIVTLNILDLFIVLSEDIYNYFIFIYLLLVIAIYIVIPILLMIHLPSFSKFSYYLLISFLLSTAILSIIYSAIENTLSIASIIGSCLWYVPNFIYFYKREKLFLKEN